jgi:uncharacterized membrane protein
MTDEPPPKPPGQTPPESPQQEQGRTVAGGISISPPTPTTAHFPYPPGTGLVGLQQAVQIWQSPYPPPDAVERYEKICPGAFDRILAMAERLQAAQIEQGRTVAQFTQNDTKRGQWLGFLVAIGSLLGVVASLALGSPWVAVAFLSVPVMAVAKALIDSAKASPAPEPPATQPTTPPPPAIQA